MCYLRTIYLSSLTNLNLFSSRYKVGVYSRHPITVQHNGPQHDGTRARTSFEIFDYNPLHFIPLICAFPHLCVCASASRLLSGDSRTESQIANRSHVVVRHEVGDLEC